MSDSQTYTVFIELNNQEFELFIRLIEAKERENEQRQPEVEARTQLWNTLSNAVDRLITFLDNKLSG